MTLMIFMFATTFATAMIAWASSTMKRRGWL